MKTFWVMTIFYCVMLSIIALAVSLAAVREYRDTLEIRAHGVRTEAILLRYYKGECGKSGCNLNIDYTYQADYRMQHSGEIFHGTGYIKFEHLSDNPDYQYLAFNQSVPIVYDKTNPGRSNLNFRDWIFAQDPLKKMWKRLRLLSIGTTVIFSILEITIFIATKYRIEKLDSLNLQD